MNLHYAKAELIDICLPNTVFIDFNRTKYMQKYFPVLR